MYEQHFGLKKRPFRATATGTDVFVGPHIAATMAGIKKALSANDAIVAVSGPVGSGKTTLVARALESISDNRIIIRVARMRLDSEDVLELLLDELGVQDKPRGTIQKFAFFRRRLRELEENKTRVFVAIEDSVRLGADTLAEIEALTSAEAGESEGASVVLMGDDRLDALLGEPQLVRIQQRIRQRFTVAPLCAAELRGYLRHCFRLAGGEFERTFEANAAQLLHHLSKGIPRIANNLVESAMTAAADQDANQVASALVARIAENEYGFSAAGFDLTPPVEPPTAEEEPVAVPIPESVPEPVLEPVAEPVPSVPELVVEPVPEPVAEAIVAPVLKPVPVPEPVPEQVFAATQPAEPLPEPSIEEAVIVFAEEDTEEAAAEIEIPELIQDTLPNLQILAPEFAAPPEPNPEPVLEVPPEPKLEVESTGNDVPDWDRDPTMAELKPDLAALEQAMAFAQGDDPDPAAGDAGPLPVPEPEVPEVIPEITLDHAISQRIESNLIDEPGEVSLPAPEKDAPAMKNAPDTPVVKLPQQQNKKADAELERIAVELAKAKSIEDIDDKLAETLFGEELNLIAAHILANPPSAEPANDDIEAIAVNPQENIPEPAAGGPEVGHQSSDVDFEVTLAAPVKLDDSGMDLSASQRLKTVRALNADLHPSIREPEATSEERLPPSSAPESIEDQINTSMTQTLKALNVVPPVIDDDMDDEEARGGFFSRFKRS
jgi:general secretion pathway protein A